MHIEENDPGDSVHEILSVTMSSEPLGPSLGKTLTFAARASSEKLTLSIAGQPDASVKEKVYLMLASATASDFNAIVVFVVETPGVSLTDCLRKHQCRRKEVATVRMPALPV